MQTPHISLLLGPSGGRDHVTHFWMVSSAHPGAKPPNTATTLLNQLKHYSATDFNNCRKTFSKMHACVNFLVVQASLKNAAKPLARQSSFAHLRLCCAAFRHKLKQSQK